MWKWNKKICLKQLNQLIIYREEIAKLVLRSERINEGLKLDNPSLPDWHFCGVLLSNARQFYSSMANPLGRKGLSTSVKLLKWVETNSVLNSPQVIFHFRNIFIHESPLIKSNSIFICPNQIKRWLCWCWIPCTGTTLSTQIPLWTRLPKISLCGLKNSWYSPKDAREKHW